MQVDEDESEVPPAYAALHGRVLGTGEEVNVLAPPGMNMTQQRNLERLMRAEEEDDTYLPYEDRFDEDDNPIEPPPGRRRR